VVNITQLHDFGHVVSRHVRRGTRGGIRTPDTLFRRQVLYPAELLAQNQCSIDDHEGTRIGNYTILETKTTTLSHFPLFYPKTMIFCYVYLEKIRNKKKYLFAGKVLSIGVTLGLMVSVISLSYRATKLSQDPNSRAETGNEVQTYTATADTYVDSKKPKNNYGTSKSLITQYNPENITYLKFNLSSIPLSTLITGATLSLHTTATSSTGISVALVSDSSWVENSVTYSTKLIRSTTEVVTANTAISNSRISFNIAQLVTPRLGGDISFAVISTKNKVTFTSKESTTPPQLTIQFPTTPTVEPTGTTIPTDTVEPSITATSTPTIAPSKPPVSSNEQCNPVNKTASTLTELKTAVEQSQPGDHIQLKNSFTGTFTASFPGVTTDAYRCLSYAPGVQTNGLFRATSPDKWIFENIKATWATAAASEHMFRISGGTGWILRNSEIWGAQSFANLHITGAASSYKVINNYIHNVADVLAVNTDVQNHNIYISNADDGIIAGNRITNAPRGRCIKVANSSSTSTENPDRNILKYNTFRDCSGPTLAGVSYGATGNEFHHNIFENGPCVMNVQTITGAGNKMYNNIYWNVPGDCMVTNATNFTYSDMIKADPMFDTNDVPTATAVVGYGHTAYTGE
jgi:hypothetical protein